jgi:NADPH:quinone reductase-like Zn-dependent oxidoreductase
LRCTREGRLTGQRPSARAARTVSLDRFSEQRARNHGVACARLSLHLRGRIVFMTGAAKPMRQDLEFLKSLIESGQLRPVIGRTFALRDIVEAHRYADANHKVGNVVITVAN